MEKRRIADQQVGKSVFFGPKMSDAALALERKLQERLEAKQAEKEVLNLSTSFLPEMCSVRTGLGEGKRGPKGCPRRRSEVVRREEVCEGARARGPQG